MNIKDKNVLFTIEWGGSACRLGPGDVVLARRELGKAHTDSELKARLVRELDEYLERPHDRALFGLPTLR